MLEGLERRCGERRKERDRGRNGSRQRHFIRDGFIVWRKEKKKVSHHFFTINRFEFDKMRPPPSLEKRSALSAAAIEN